MLCAYDALFFCTLPYYFSGIKTGQPDLWGSDTTKNPFCPVKPYFAAKTTTLLQQAPFVGHLSRQKFVGQFIIGLIKSRNVQFGEVAQHFNDAAKPAASAAWPKKASGKRPSRPCKRPTWTG